MTWTDYLAAALLVVCVVLAGIAAVVNFALWLTDLVERRREQARLRSGQPKRI